VTTFPSTVVPDTGEVTVSEGAGSAERVAAGDAVTAGPDAAGRSSSAPHAVAIRINPAAIARSGRALASMPAT
jgi:hypothetical protein